MENILSTENNDTELNCSIAVIVYIYNNIKSLNKAVEILKAQDLDNLKFIIIDDASSDGSSSCIANIISDDTRFSLINNQEKIGLAASYNKAIQQVNSEYIYFFNIDDEIPNVFFKKLYKKALSSNADIVFTNYNDKIHCLNIITYAADKYKVLRDEATWDKIYRTSLLKDNKIEFKDKLKTSTINILFNVQAFQAAQKIVLVKEPRCLHVSHTNSINTEEQNLIKIKQEIITNCRKTINYVIENEFTASAKLFLQDFLKNYYSNYYKEDEDFRYKLYIVLKNIDIKIKSLRDIKPLKPADYELLADTEYFDEKYYRLHNPSLWFKQNNLLEHYLTIGWLKGKNPSAKFDGNKYLYVHKDVAKAGMNPLVHYLHYGIKEERTIYPVKTLFSHNKIKYPVRIENEYALLKNSEYFDSLYYRLHNPLLWFSHKNLLKHYLIFGWLEGKNPSAKFDGNKYLALNQDVDKAQINPLVHYIGNGAKEGRKCFAVKNMSDMVAKIRYALEYPIRVQEEYYRLNAEIKALENKK